VNNFKFLDAQQANFLQLQTHEGIFM